MQDRPRFVAYATGGRHISVVVALLSAGGDGIPSGIRHAVASTPFL